MFLSKFVCVNSMLAKVIYEQSFFLFYSALLKMNSLCEEENFTNIHITWITIIPVQLRLSRFLILSRSWKNNIRKQHIQKWVKKPLARLSMKGQGLPYQTVCDKIAAVLAFATQVQHIVFAPTGIELSHQKVSCEI